MCPRFRKASVFWEVMRIPVTGCIHEGEDKETCEGDDNGNAQFYVPGRMNRENGEGDWLCQKGEEDKTADNALVARVLCGTGHAENTL